MNELEKLREFLLSYPGWGDYMLALNDTDGKPGSAGLFPVGMEEVSRQTDVQGNTLVCNRLHFLLHRITPDRQDDMEAAAWLLDFQKWVQQQSACCQAPQLGCLPQKERICAYDGKLLRRDAQGAAVYQLQLWVEFATYLEGWVDDGSGV